MGSLAAAMTDLVQQIHRDAAHRRTHLAEMRARAYGMLGEFRTSQRTMATALQYQATELKRKLEAAEKARLDAAQKFMSHTRRLIQHIGVRVSELRSDTHNLIQRFTIEHRDMGQAMRGTLAAAATTRVETARQGLRRNQARRQELRARLRAEAQSLYASLHQHNHARLHAARQRRQTLTADIRQASRTWRQGLKKKPSVPYQG